MKLYSTKNKKNEVSFKDAILRGTANDGGLFMPSTLPKLSTDFIDNLGSISFNEIAFTISKLLLNDEIPSDELKNIIEDSLTFDAPLVSLDPGTYILELFHGPTLAFKDFGARFMAKTLSYFTKDINQEIIILVATSGDTGSAVAQGFYHTGGIKVVLLYPSNMVSFLQEKQLTTLNDNITALEVDGTFDDCQKLVKLAFLDKNLNKSLILSSANSINIARLIPQSFYYFYAYSQLENKKHPVIFSVPSGNFGNLTAGLFAKEMGLPVKKFIAGTNINDVFPKYLNTGKFNPQPSVKTISNAMDVGNPSNFDRILDLYNHEYEVIKKNIYSASFNDDQTKEAMKEIFKTYNYVIDPHGAIGYLAIKKYIEEQHDTNSNKVILETAHPAKFINIVEETIGVKIEMPERLMAALNKEKKSIRICNDFNEFKNFLLTDL